MFKYLLLVALATAVPVSVWAKPGHLFLLPNTLETGTTETISLTLYDIPAGGNVVVSLMNNELNKTYQQVSTKIENPSPEDGQSIAIQFPVQKLDSGSAMLRVEGSFDNEGEKYTFNKTSRVGLANHNDVVLVQTDQPIYKPGQLVRFRVIAMDHSLKFLEKAVKADIFIENESGIRLFQSRGNEFHENFVQLEMQLPDQPTLGTYTINVNMTETGIMTTQTFRVDEFVLPKFQVIITPPPFALVSDELITFKICGRYTYGQLVNGNLTVSATYETYSWDRNFEMYPKIRHSGPIEGCYNFTINQKELHWLNSTFRYRDMKITAKIVEDGTDIEQNATSSLKLQNDPVRITFSSDGSYSQYFKPGLPIHGTLTVTNPDNSPRADETVQLCLVATAEARPSSSLYRLEKKLACQNFTSDAQGTVKYTLPPGPSKMTQLKVQADAVKFPQYNNPTEPQQIIYYRPSNSKIYNQWYSPSKHFIQIEPIKGDAPCGETLNFTVLMTGNETDVLKIYTHVMARGKIVMHTSIEQKFKDIQKPLENDGSFIIYEDETSDYFKNDIASGSFNLPLSITPDMAPKAHVLVTYVLKDTGEVVADAIDIPIAKCLKNNVSMHFTNQKQYPGTKVGLRIKASPKSLCGISVVDKSLRLLSSNGQITLETVLQNMEQLDSNNYYWYNRQNCDFRTVKPVPYFNVEVSKRRKRSTMWRPEGGYSSKADSSTAIQKSRMIIITDLWVDTKPCENYNRPPVASYGYSTRPLHSTMKTRPVAAFGGGSALAMRPQAANDMLEISKVGIVQEDAVRGSGIESASIKPVKEVRVDFPDTWLWDLVTLDDEGESLTKHQLPDTITEWQGNAVCVSPKDGLGASPTASVIGFQPFFVSYTLPYSIIRGEKSPVIVSVFNYLDKCLPVALTLDLTDEFTLESPSQNVTLCVCGGKSATETYLVKPKVLGQLNFTVRAYTVSDATICGEKEIETVSARDAATNSLIVEPEGFKRDVTISSFFCPEKDGNLQTHLDLETPEGLVEGSMKATFSVCGDLMGPTLKNIENLIQMPTGCGEQNMINFVPDIFIMSYLKASGRLTPELKDKLERFMVSGYQRELTYRHVDGSYSAFGTSDKEGSIWLTAFVVKSFKGASEYIPVDNTDITRSAAYITSQQQKSGCFPEVGELHHKAMKGGVESAKGSKALTAYILAALLEAKAITNTTSALECLATETDPPTYTLAISTYASCLAESPTGKERLEALMKKAIRKDGLTYWEDELSHSLSIQLEIASYAVLSLLQPCGGQNLTQALEIIKFISKHRNANGGFVSTQDTVMALQALSAYGSHISKDQVNLKIKAESNGLSETFSVDETNKLLVQSVKVPEVPSPLEVQGNGTGCGLVQTNLRYNVQNPGNQAGFTLEITTARGADNSCKKATITICMGYQEEDKASLSSNMALLDIRLVSGYQLDVESIPPLTDDAELFFKRYDIKGNNVALYFGKVGPKKCFTLKALQEFEVTDLKPGTAKLMDYYQTEKQISKEYTIDGDCP